MVKKKSFSGLAPVPSKDETAKSHQRKFYLQDFVARAKWPVQDIA